MRLRTARTVFFALAYRISLSCVLCLLCVSVWARWGAVFAETRLLDVGLWYGRLSPTWVELRSEIPYRLVVSPYFSGDIGTTEAVGRDGDHVRTLALTQSSGEAVYTVQMKPYEGYALLLERIDLFEEPRIQERLAYYRGIGLAPAFFYGESDADAIAEGVRLYRDAADGEGSWRLPAGIVLLGYADREAAETDIPRILDLETASGQIAEGKTAEAYAVSKGDGYFVLTAPGSNEDIALISAVNKDCAVEAGISDMSCSQSENTVSYRGGFRYTLGTTGYYGLINRVDIEDYLLGVVPAEMSGSWELDALKAQAVAARNYAVSPSGKYLRFGFDLDDSTESQAYYGYSQEHPNASRAVEETRGEYMLYDGKVISMFFNASSGGFLDSLQNIWGGEDTPNFVTKPDPFSVGYRWEYTLTLPFLYEVVEEMGRDVGEPFGIEILSRTPSGRVKTMRIIGTGGSFETTGERFKAVVNSRHFKSTLFTFDPDYREYFLEIGTEEDASGKGYRKWSELVGGAVSENPPFLERGDSVSSETPPSESQSTETPPSGTVSDLSEESSGWRFMKTSEIDRDSAKKAYRAVLPNTETAGFVDGNLLVYGHGYGHGIGMSQIGARRMAQLGFSYKEILEFYYNHVESIVK